MLKALLGDINLNFVNERSPERGILDQKQLFEQLSQGNNNGAIDTLLSSSSFAQALVLAVASGPQMVQKVVQSFLQDAFERGSLFKAYFASLHGGLTSLGTSLSFFNVALCSRLTSQKARKFLKNKPICRMMMTPGKNTFCCSPACLRLARTQLWPQWVTHYEAGNAMGLPSYGNLLLPFEKRSFISQYHSFFACALHLQPLDDPTATTVLVGTDHHRHPTTFYKDTLALQLTELVEYGLKENKDHVTLPHLQSYKLYYAYLLAEMGFVESASK